MPYYDQYSGMEVETEEERKKREEEAANAVAHTQEVKTYGDGSQTVTTTQEVPAAGPIAPDETLAETQRLQRQNAQPPVAMAAPAAGAGRGFVNPAVVQPVNPAFNQEQYNAQMAQAESGGNANIGYHNQAKGSAYGPYGMTAASYADARRANPSLPADITQATPDQLTQAQNTYTQQNAQTLNSFGIPVDANTLSAAHFLGATGLKNYLESGTISRAAAAANGGEENVRKILTQRLGGTVAAASGGATAQAPQAAPAPAAVSPEDLQRQQYALGAGATGAPGLKMPMAGPAPEAGKTETQRWIDTYQSAGNDALKLLSISKDETAPQYLRERAHTQAFENMDRQIKLKDEEQRIRGLLQAGMAGDPKANKEVANEMSSKAVTMGKYVLAKLFAPELAGEYAVDLGFGNKDTVVQTPEGKSGLITVNGRGTPVKGVWADGSQMSNEEMLSAQGAAPGKVKPDVSLQDVETTVDGKTIKGRVVTTYDQQNRPTTRVESGGKYYSYTGDWKPVAISTAVEKATAQKQINLAWDPVIKAATAGAEFLGKFNAEHGTNFSIAGKDNAGKPIIVDTNTNAIVRPGAGGTVTATTGGAAGMTPAQIKQTIELGGKRSEALNKVLDEEVRPQAQAGDTVSSVRKQQFTIFDRPGIDANKIFGLYNAAQESPTDQKLSIIRDIFGGVIPSGKENEVSQRLAQLNLTPAEKSALMEYAIANQKINAATLKQTAGPGSVSDAEQKANRESNVDPTKIPALGAFNAMAQSQFDGDRARYKADWATGKEFKSALDMDKEWRKENQRLSEIYSNIAKDRVKFINENGNTYNAVREGYRRFPVPEYDPTTESWKKTKSLSSIMGGR